MPNKKNWKLLKPTVVEFQKQQNGRNIMYSNNHRILKNSSIYSSLNNSQITNINYIKRGKSKNAANTFSDNDIDGFR